MFEELRFPEDIAFDIASNEKKLRKRRGLTQKEMSKRSGVSLASLKRFEQTGEISLVSLLKIAVVLEIVDNFDELFTLKEYRSIQDVIDERNMTSRVISIRES